MYTSSIPCSCNDDCQYCLGLYGVKYAFRLLTQWNVVFAALLFKLVYDIPVICRRAYMLRNPACSLG